MGGVNLPPDVKTIQELLNKVPPNKGGPRIPLKVDGVCGPKTIKAIQTFQLFHFGWIGADGKVKPDGETLKKLNEFDGKDKPVEKEKLRSNVFKVRTIHLRDPKYIAGDVLDKGGFYYDVIDLKNNLLTIYSHDTIRNTFWKYRNYSLFKLKIEKSPFTTFSTPIAVSSASFAGRHFSITHSQFPRALEIHHFPELEGQLVNFNLVMAGLAVDDKGRSFGHGATDWDLVTEEPVSSGLAIE